jgi:DNA processing protein
MTGTDRGTGGTGATGGGGGPTTVWDTRRTAWAYLRRVVEASRGDVVRLLWPDGDVTAPADVERVAGMIRVADPALPARLAAATGPRTAADPSTDREWADRHGWRLITPDDPEWPTARLAEAFRDFPDLTDGADVAADGVRGRAARPFALWATGPADLGRAVERSVAMVGTRSATSYGTRVTRTMAGDLAAAGHTVVSGGAVGIDTAAHRGALAARGTTVAVAASGPGEIYPRANSDLFGSIAGSGLVVTEYPPLLRPARHRFLTRNRLVAALTRGTVLLAAGYRSGAVNTANWADAMLRPVMVLPGPVDSPDYVGCHKRLRDQAGILVTRAADVREILDPVGAVDTDGQLRMEFAATPVQQLTQDQLAVFDACALAGGRTDGTGTPDRIVAETGLALRAVVRIIAELEKAGLARREGSRWIKTDR